MKKTKKNKWKIEDQKSEVRCQTSDTRFSNIKHQTQRGITLVALVITVIVLLILAGTAISIAINGGDIFGKASQARESWNTAVATEEQKINEVWNILNTMTGTISTQSPTPTPSGLTMTLDGVQVIGITQANFGQYLGKVVNNYSGAATSVTNSEGTFNVSNTYRLYWIDWDNKYGDGAGTIYLKADVTTANTKNYNIGSSTNKAYDGAAATSKLQQLNPALYATNVTPPTSTNGNMKAVRWLTDTAKWFDNTHATKLTVGLAPAIAAKVNYVVGAPSIEMMVDSYNTHYGLTNETMDTGARDASLTTRTKIGCIYPLQAGNSGYGVGPSNDTYAVNGCYVYSSNAIVQSDSSIDNMYYPGNNNWYWLASPSHYGFGGLVAVGGVNGGYISYADFYSGSSAFCPLVSLQSDVVL